MASVNEIILLLVEIQVFTASGALAPGPLSMATLGSGLRRGWRAGVMASTGHLSAELPIFLLVAYGVLSIESIAGIRNILLAVASIFLFYLGYLHMKVGDVEFEALEEARHPFTIGFVFSLFNPYFILWWVTIGSIFIYDAIKILGFIWLPAIYLAHVWMDYAWLTFLSFLANLGVTRFSSRFLKYVNISLGAILVLFGLTFAYDVLIHSL